MTNLRKRLVWSHEQDVERQSQVGSASAGKEIPGSRPLPLLSIDSCTPLPNTASVNASLVNDSQDLKSLTGVLLHLSR